MMVCGRRWRKEGAETASTSCFLVVVQWECQVCAFRQSLPFVKLPRCSVRHASLNHIKPHQQEACHHCYYQDKDPVFSSCTIIILSPIKLFTWKLHVFFFLLETAAQVQPTAIYSSLWTTSSGAFQYKAGQQDFSCKLPTLLVSHSKTSPLPNLCSGIFIPGHTRAFLWNSSPKIKAAL